MAMMGGSQGTDKGKGKALAALIGNAQFGFLIEALVQELANVLQ